MTYTSILFYSINFSEKTHEINRLRKIILFFSSSKSIQQQKKERVQPATLGPIKWFLANRLSSDILADIDIADNLDTFSVCTQSLQV